MRIRLLAALGVAVAASSFSALVPGCGAVTTATTGAQTGVSTVQTGQSTGQQAGGLLGDAKNAIIKKDDSSNDDDDRLKAKEAAVNTPLNDSLNAKKKDYQDWRKFDLQGKPGIATFELFWDNDQANLEIDVFDAFGVNIGKSPPRMEGQSSKRILVQIDKMQRYYVRVRLPKMKGDSIYTLNVKWAAPPPPVVKEGPTPIPTPVNPPPSPQGAQPPPPDAGVPSLLTDPNKLVANIISAYRDNGGWVLYLDKGSSAKVHAGQTGVMLVGADGEQLVPDGGVTISQVVDNTKSIARCNLKQPPGKNKRVVINLR